MKQVLLGMSGGVDSTAAVLLLKEAGYRVTGAYLQMHSGVDPAAGAAAEKLGIPFYAPDCREAFCRLVKDNFVQSYVDGDTPNPCVRCNKTVKFPELLALADALGIDSIATGHYARVRYNAETGMTELLRAKDRRKDQSYVLYPLGQEVLRRLVLPLGDYEKPQIREKVRSAALENADRGDSQDICFVPDGDYMAFLTAYGGVSPVPGDFVDEEGKVLGRHKGLEGYTRGQRRGLGVSAAYPLYVLGKDRATNTVTLGKHEDLFTSSLVAEDFCWTSIPTPKAPLSVTAKTRYSQTEAAATAEVLPDGRVSVVFETPQRAVTEGQSVVLYLGDTVAGGGIIREVGR